MISLFPRTAAFEEGSCCCRSMSDAFSPTLHGGRIRPTLTDCAAYGDSDLSLNPAVKPSDPCMNLGFHYRAVNGALLLPAARRREESGVDPAGRVDWSWVVPPGYASLPFLLPIWRTSELDRVSCFSGTFTAVGISPCG